jgi:MFS family permease
VGRPDFGKIWQRIRPVWASRNFQIVFLARIAMSTGRALAGVATPIYLALQGFNAFEFSEYVMAVAFASALLSTGVGLLSDKHGRRLFLVIIPLLTATTGIVFALTDSTPLLFVMGAVGTFGRGSGAGGGTIGPYQPAESAFVTDEVDSRDRNAAFGRLAFGSSLGATAGGLLALLVHATHVHGAAATDAYRPVFLAICAVSALAGLLALSLSEPGQTEMDRDWTNLERGPHIVTPDNATATPRWWHLRFPRRSWWLLSRLWVTNTVNGIAVGMFGPFVTYWFFRRFGAGPAKIGVLFAVINIVTMPSTLSAAAFARRWGLVRTISVVRTIQAILLVPMVLSPTFAAAGAIYLVRMTVQRVGQPLRQSYAIGLADAAERSSVAALSNLPSQLAMSASPLLSGYLIDEVSLAVPFEISAICQFANAATFWWFFHLRPPEEELSASKLVTAPSLTPETTD